MTLFAILTLFPNPLEAYAAEGILRVARDKGKVRIQCIDFRDFTRDRHRSVDDRPFGGGPGMLLAPEPIAECVEWLEARHGRFRRLVLCPGGTPFRQPFAEELAREERILLLCGRYEGFDARLIDVLGFEELSVGDYVLAGGEIGALAVTEAVVRLLPGVLGDERSAAQDSFGPTGQLDCPHYTRPRVWRGQAVPDVLLSGDHAAIARWRRDAASARTRERRPDLTPKPQRATPTPTPTPTAAPTPTPTPNTGEPARPPTSSSPASAGRSSPNPRPASPPEAN